MLHNTFCRNKQRHDDALDNNAIVIEINKFFEGDKIAFKLSYTKQNLTLMIISY